MVAQSVYRLGHRAVAFAQLHAQLRGTPAHMISYIYDPCGGAKIEPGGFGFEELKPWRALQSLSGLHPADQRHGPTGSRHRRPEPAGKLVPQWVPSHSGGCFLLPETLM